MDTKTATIRGLLPHLHHIRRQLAENQVWTRILLAVSQAIHVDENTMFVPHVSSRRRGRGPIGGAFGFTKNDRDLMHCLGLIKWTYQRLNIVCQHRRNYAHTQGAKNKRRLMMLE